MEPRIDTLSEKKLVGMRRRMSLTNNHTRELWQGFMPRRKEVQGMVGTDLHAVQQYAPGYFDSFDPGNEFEKWAAVEVNALSNIPEGMETFILPAGLYAVFIHKGPASEAARTFNYIFAEWLPASKYAVDDRPHFEIIGEKYKHDHPDSEEEVWVPVKMKTK